VFDVLILENHHCKIIERFISEIAEICLLVKQLSLNKIKTRILFKKRKCFHLYLYGSFEKWTS